MNPKLEELLIQEHVDYEVIRHRDAFTAQERAAACHISGRRLAKVVVVCDGNWFALLVVPATAQVDLAHLRRVSGQYGLRLAGEEEFAPLFPDCHVGAMPPFGRLYGGLAVYLDRALADTDDLVFEGGTHREDVRIPMAEYLRLERPAIVPLTRTARAA